MGDADFKEQSIERQTGSDFNSKKESDILNHNTKSAWYKAFCESWFVRNVQIMILVVITVILISAGLDISFGKGEDSIWLRISFNLVTFLAGWLIPKKP